MGGVFVMWFDNEAGKPLGAKVIQAVAYYVRRFGEMPDVAFVNEWEYSRAGEDKGADKLTACPTYPVEVRPVRWVLVNHVMVGITEITENTENTENTEALRRMRR